MGQKIRMDALREAAFRPTSARKQRAVTVASAHMDTPDLPRISVDSVADWNKIKEDLTSAIAASLATQRAIADPAAVRAHLDHVRPASTANFPFTFHSGKTFCLTLRGQTCVLTE